MTAVISPQLRLSLGMVFAECSAHGYRGDECVLACAGISAGRRSLHSDEKGSTQRLPVSMVNYEISLWAAEPRERLGSELMWDQLVLCQAVTHFRNALTNCSSKPPPLSFLVHRHVFGHLGVTRNFEATTNGCIYFISSYVPLYVPCLNFQKLIEQLFVLTGSKNGRV